MPTKASACNTITGNYAAAATWTVISGATSDLSTREEFVLYILTI